MPEMGTLPIDWTVCLFASALNILEDGLTFKACETMAGGLAVAVAESWTSLQCAMGERLQRDLNQGYINDAQYDFALTWLSELGHMEFEESVEQFFAWASWVRENKFAVEG